MGSVRKLVGRVFGKLTVIKRDGSDKHKKALWLCKCECGRFSRVSSGCLISGNSKGCGGKGCQRGLTHGLSYLSIYRTWNQMIQRCNNENCVHYKYYGGRGITVCNRWRKSAKDFVEDMGSKPNLASTLERIDNNGNYEPSNCEWATRTQQVRNRRLQHNNKSGCSGVRLMYTGKWQANITHKNKTIYLGRFSTLEKAIEARRKGESKYWKNE